MATPDTGSQGIVGFSMFFGGLGLTGNPKKLLDTDLGVLVDGSEVAAQALSDIDSGTGVEGTESIDTSNAADADAGTVGESESLDITLQGAAAHKDSGVVVELGGTAQVEVQITSTDEGVIVDTTSIAITLSSDDSGVIGEVEAIAFDRRLTITIDSISQPLTMTITYEGG